MTAPPPVIDTSEGGPGSPGGAAVRADPLTRLDELVDALFDPVRGHRGLDVTAAIVSNLADYGFVWAVAAAVKARRAGPSRARAVGALAWSGVTSAAANRLVKELVRRERPESRSAAGSPLLVRPPRSSSFPSGHTLAAFSTAIVLADTPVQTAGFVGFAAAVAVSRVHLRAHHPSDVVGGAVIGTALGLSVRRLRRRPRGVPGGRPGRAARE